MYSRGIIVANKIKAINEEKPFLESLTRKQLVHGQGPRTTDVYLYVRHSLTFRGAKAQPGHNGDNGLQ